MTENELRLRSALCAALWIGTKEGSGEHQQILDLYNGIRPLPRGYAISRTDPWCAAFVSACALEAGLQRLYPLECSCSRIILKAREMGIWVEDDGQIPQIADWVLYNWDAQPQGDDLGAPDHIGIVISVEEGSIAVVEGNYDNAVKLRRIKVDDRRIRGFVCPKFWEEEKESTMIYYHRIEEVPAYARETVEKLMNDGSLLGVTEDDLGLTEELLRVLVILDRRGKL